MICSVELPIKYLEKYSQYFDFDFVIASTCVDYPEYFEYFKKTKRFMILDNGAFETGQAIDDKKYYEIAMELKPDILILPDVKNDHKRSIQRASTFLKEAWKNNPIPGVNLMGVLPGHSEEQVMDEYLLYTKHLGVTLFGFPYTPGVNRYLFLKKHPEIKDVHILGLPVLSEVLALNLLPNVKSIDSSLPVKCAVDGVVSMLELLASDTKVIPTKDNLNEDLLKENLQIYRDICEGRCWVRKIGE